MAWQTIDQQYEKDTNRNDRSNYLKDIIAGLSIATNNDPMTLLGYGISRFLSNYFTRGEQRRREEKRNDAWNKRNGGGNETTAPASVSTPTEGSTAQGLLSGLGGGSGVEVSPEEAQMYGEAWRRQNPVFLSNYGNLGLRR